MDYLDILNETIKNSTNDNGFKTKRESKEFKLSYSKIGYPYYKIGSLASSARLGFLYLCSKYDPNNIKLE